MLPALFWLAVVTVLLCLPGAAFPSNDWFSLVWLDKWIHVGLFAILVFLFCLSIRGDKPNRTTRFMFVAVGCAFYGLALEFVQDEFIPHRTFDVWDIAANIAGCCAGVIVSFRLLPDR